MKMSLKKVLRWILLILAPVSLVSLALIPVFAISCSKSDKTPNSAIKIDSAKIQSMFSNMSIENLDSYFDNVNRLPDSQNTAVLKKSVFANATGINIDDIVELNVTRDNDAGTDENNFLYLNLFLNIKNPEKYGLWNNMINFNSLLTSIYDVNSDLNKSYISFRGSLLDYFNENISNYKNRVFYFPYCISRISSPSFSYKNIPEPLKVLDFRFTSLSSVRDAASIFRDAPYLEEINFSGISVDFSFGGKTNVFRDIKTLKKIDFSYTNTTQIPGQMFHGDTSLQEVNLTGCNNLNSIGWDSFWGCSSLETIDFSSSTITYVDNSAFNGCTNLKTIYVKDDASKQIFENALPQDVKEHCRVIIKTS